MRQQPSCCKFLQLSPCKSQQWLYEKWSWNGILKRMYYWSTGSLSLNTMLSNVLYIVENATFIAWALGQVQYVWNSLEGVPHFCPLPLGSECSGLFFWSHMVTFYEAMLITTVWHWTVACWRLAFLQSTLVQITVYSVLWDARFFLR